MANSVVKGVVMAESIRELMTKNPRSLESGSSVVEAARIMRDEDAGIVPVVESDKERSEGADTGVQRASGEEREPPGG